MDYSGLATPKTQRFPTVLAKPKLKKFPTRYTPTVLFLFRRRFVITYLLYTRDRNSHPMDPSHPLKYHWCADEPLHPIYEQCTISTWMCTVTDAQHRISPSSSTRVNTRNRDFNPVTQTRTCDGS